MSGIRVKDHRIRQKFGNKKKSEKTDRSQLKSRKYMGKQILTLVQHMQQVLLTFCTEII
jgi:hypothetical protein